MELEEALTAVQQIDGLPLLRQCCECKKWLDEQSEVVANSAREDIGKLFIIPTV